MTVRELLESTDLKQLFDGGFKAVVICENYTVTLANVNISYTEKEIASKAVNYHLVDAYERSVKIYV
jgi:hypothetical protein